MNMRVTAFLIWISFVLSATVSLPTALASSETPTLFGVIGDNENKRAWLGVDIKNSRWHREGSLSGGYEIVEIQTQKGYVVVRKPGQQNITIWLSGMGGPSEPESTLIPLEELDWAWIKSDQNPMKNAPRPLPEWIVLSWKQMRERARIDIYNYYRVHGWNLVQVEVKEDGRILQGMDPLADPTQPQPTMEEVRRRSIPAGKAMKPNT
jgi:hypothetical protein